MNYRKIHKEKLQAILQSISFEGKNLTVDTKYRNGATTDPYFYLVSGAVALDEEGQGRLLDTGIYQMIYTYGLVMHIRYKNDDKNDPMQSDRIDLLESQIIDQLQRMKVKDDLQELYTSQTLKGYNQWSDLRLTKISEIDEIDPEINDQKLYKIYTITINQLVPYDRG